MTRQRKTLAIAALVCLLAGIAGFFFGDSAGGVIATVTAGLVGILVGRYHRDTAASLRVGVCSPRADVVARSYPTMLAA